MVILIKIIINNNNNNNNLEPRGKNGGSECNPLEWWKIYQSQLPHIASLARKYLCIPSTFVPSEKAFSCTGNIVNVKRSCLLPENVNKLTFLANNLL